MTEERLELLNRGIKRKYPKHEFRWDAHRNELVCMDSVIGIRWGFLIPEEVANGSVTNIIIYVEEEYKRRARRDGMSVRQYLDLADITYTQEVPE